MTFEQQKEFKKLEREIEKIETKKEGIQNRFSTEALDPKDIEELSITLGKLASFSKNNYLFSALILLIFFTLARTSRNNSTITTKGINLTNNLPFCNSAHGT